MKYICKKFINHQIKKCLLAISLSSCSRYNANIKLDQSVRKTTQRNIVGEPRPRSLMNFRLR
jgi:hypothetical protein